MRYVFLILLMSCALACLLDRKSRVWGWGFLAFGAMFVVFAR